MCERVFVRIHVHVCMSTCARMHARWGCCSLLLAASHCFVLLRRFVFCAYHALLFADVVVVLLFVVRLNC